MCLRYVILIVLFLFALKSQAQEQNNQLSTVARWWDTFQDEQLAEKSRIWAGIELQKYYSGHNLDSQLLVCHLLEDYGLKHNNRIWQGHAWRGYGVYHLLTGKPDSAIWAYNRALAMGDGNALYGSVLSSIGTYHKLAEQTDSALYYFEKAIPFAKQYQDTSTITNTYLNLGSTLLDIGRTGDAVRVYEEGKKYANNAYHLTVAINLAGMFVDVNMLAEAKTHAWRALDLSRETNSISGQIAAYRVLAATEQSDFETFEHYVTQGIQLAEQYDVKRNLCHLLRVAGSKAYLVFGNIERGEYYLERAVNIGLEHAGLSSYLSSLYELAKIRLAQNKPHEALRLNQLIQANIREEGQFGDAVLFNIYLVFSETFEQLGQLDSSFYYLKKMNAAEVRAQDFERYNNMVASYLNYQYEEKTATLQSEKAAAEAIAIETRRREKANYRLWGVLALLLTGIAAALVIFSRQKQLAAKKITLANTALQAERENLQRSNAKLERFSNIVSHDILSNLDIVLSSGRALVGSAPKPEHLLQYHSITQNTARQLKNYCLQLLQEAQQKTDAASTALHDPMPALKRVLQRLSPALKEARFELDIRQLSPSPLPPALCEQVFQNLLSNAIRHGATAPKPVLRVYETQGPSGKPGWAVEDNGPGIPPGLRESIFTRTVKSPQHGKGQQMGLALLQASLREHQAQLHLEDNPSGGARFILTFNTTEQHNHD